MKSSPDELSQAAKLADQDGRPFDEELVVLIREGLAIRESSTPIRLIVTFHRVNLCHLPTLSEQAADQAVAEEIGGLANGIQSPMTIHIPDWIFLRPIRGGGRRLR